MERDLETALMEQLVWAVEPFRPLATESGNAVSHERFSQRPDLWPTLRLIKAAQVTPGLPAVVLTAWGFSLEQLPESLRNQLLSREPQLGMRPIYGRIPSELAEGIAKYASEIEPIRTWQEVLQEIHPRPAH